MSLIKRRKLNLDDVRHKDPIMDGVVTKQLYICPSCGSKHETKKFERCARCNIAVCGNPYSEHDGCSHEIRWQDYYSKATLCKPCHSYIVKVIKRLIAESGDSEESEENNA